MEVGEDQCCVGPELPISMNNVSEVASSPVDNFISPYNDKPTILVCGSSDDIKKILKDDELLSSPSSTPPKCRTDFCIIPPHLNTSNYSLSEQRAQSQDDFRRSRHHSANETLYYKQYSDISPPGSRFCTSEEGLDQMTPSPVSRAETKKNKFLTVENELGRTRKRSASTDGSMYPSTRFDLMKRFFQRMRSHSHGNLDFPRDIQASFSTSKVNSCEDIPKSPTNTGFLSKVKKHLGKPGSRTLAESNLSKPQSFHFDDSTIHFEGSSDIMSSLEDIIDCDTDNFGDYSQKDSDSPHSSRSELKPKKKGRLERNFVSRFKELHWYKKRDRGGSLPNVLSGIGIYSPKFKEDKESEIESGRESDSPKRGTRRKRSTLSDQDVKGDKTVYLGEFTIDDHFGEIQSFSLENLDKVGSETREKTSLKNNIFKYSFENIFKPTRGKSQSVDSSFHKAFDLEHLKRKLGDRTASEPTRTEISDPAEAGGERGSAASVDKKDSPKTILTGPVISYTVQASDTLMSIAARFDTTPSELTKMNRLSTRFLFPGQILSVPDKGGAKENLGGEVAPAEATDAVKDTQYCLTDGPEIEPTKASLRGPMPRTPANSMETDRSLDKECLEKFLKIQVRHITDGQGVVAGVLLVTPNAIMFDPNVSDPLVIERGPENYGVIAPMEFVVNAALYYDIAHMKVKDTGLPRPEMPKPEIYLGPSSAAPEDPRLESGLEPPPGPLCPNEESPSKEGTFPELGGSHDNDNDSSCSCGGDTRDSSAFPKAFEHELLTPISSDGSPTEGRAPSVGGVQTPVPPAPTSPESGAIPPATKEDVEEASLPAPPPPTLPAPRDGGSGKRSPMEEPVSKPPLVVSSSLPLVNDKKRTTSVTFASSAENEMPPLPEDEGAEPPSQESRKQKVLKRISYPLSWMESLSGESKDAAGHAHQPIPPSGSPGSGAWIGTSGGTGQPGPLTGDLSDANRQGMFSNVFSMSNVSNMLTRRASLDFVRRPHSQGAEPHQLPHLYSSSSPDPPHVDPTTTTTSQQAQKRTQFKEGTKFGFKSMVSMDDMPALFASFDKLIPKPASSCDESPLYLCLRMGAPTEKIIPRTTPIMTYGKKMMKPEYWFSIPKNRTDELYNFFQIWARDLYGELDEEAARSRGFVVLEEDLEIWSDGPGVGSLEGGLNPAGELKEMTIESWEVVSMSEELRKALYSSSSLTSLDIEVFLPEIQGSSEIIDDVIRKNMYRKLPARVQGYNWRLIFSTAQHGFSLKSLYRKMANLEMPVLLFIQDTNQNKFGAFLSCPLRVSDLFYGTGESFLFTCQPEFKVFPWTGENTFFFKGNNESLFIGGGDGNFGIVLDGDLYQGRSQSCKTFANPVLSSSEDFIIKTVECWYFD